MNTSSTNQQQINWTPKHSPWLLALPTMLAAFMFVLDETIANVALPHMAGTFSVSREESTWILTSYLVASGIIIPTVDWFCKVMGRKNFFIFSIILFTVSSFLCGIASSMGMMIFARILQGFGGGGLLPISQSVLLESFPPDKRPQAMSAFGLVVVIAPIVGPVIGGYITENFSWPWIFFINVPIGFLAVYLTKTFLEDPPYAKKQDNVKIDALGFFLLTLFLVTLQVTLDKGNNADWFNATWICQLATVSGISAILFVIYQLKTKEPLVDLTVFKDKNYAIATGVQIVMQAVLLASLTILPQFLQGLMGYDAFLSGLSMMPRGLGSLLAMVICGTLSNKIDPRLMVGLGLASMGLGGWFLGELNLQMANANIYFPNFLFGLGLGLAMIPIISLSVITLRNDQMTNASGVQNLLKNIGGAIGTSIVATLITRYSQIHQHYMVDHLHNLNPVYETKLYSLKSALMQYFDPVSALHMAKYSLYGDLQTQATLWGFIEVFRFFAMASFAIIPLLLLLKTSKNKN